MLETEKWYTKGAQSNFQNLQKGYRRNQAKYQTWNSQEQRKHTDSTNEGQQGQLPLPPLNTDWHQVFNVSTFIWLFYLKLDSGQYLHLSCKEWWECFRGSVHHQYWWNKKDFRGWEAQLNKGLLFLNKKLSGGFSTSGCLGENEHLRSPPTVSEIGSLLYRTIQRQTLFSFFF